MTVVYIILGVLAYVFLLGFVLSLCKAAKDGDRMGGRR